MAADTSSRAAAITLVVEAAAAALASLSDEPMPATAAADPANMSGAAIKYDIVDLPLANHLDYHKRGFSIGCPASSAYAWLRVATAESAQFTGEFQISPRALTEKTAIEALTPVH
jgi:hypothetical protein